MNTHTSKRMPFARIGTVLVLTCRTAACTTAPLGLRYAERSAVRVATDKATLVIYREFAAPLAWHATVHLGERELVTLVNGDYTTLQLQPGTYALKTVWPMLSAAGTSYPLNITLRASEVGYVELVNAPGRRTTTWIDPKSGLSTTMGELSTALVQRTAADAHGRLQRCCAHRGLSTSKP